MKITFDPAKRDATLRERGLDFEDAVEVFEGVAFSREDERADYGETRIITVGVAKGRTLVVVWTPRGETRRVISMRMANDREKTFYARYREDRERPREG